MNRPWVKRALPFIIYILFIPLYGLIKPFASEETVSITSLMLLLYCVKIFAVSLALAWFWKSYDELSLPAFNFTNLLIGLAVGIIVFAFWIRMDWEFAAVGGPEIFDPHVLTDGLVYFFIAVRMLGTSVVVPIFEELFWRSLIIRYIINPDFTSVKLGTFTWSSFIVSSLLFGLEHNLWLAGILAGVFYNLLLYRTKNLFYCILAHGITNFILGVYVIKTGSWQFW